MVKACLLTHHQAPADTRLDNVSIAFRSQCNPPAKPGFFTQRQYFFQRVKALVVPISKRNLLRSDIDSMKALYVPLNHGFGICVPVDWRSNQRLTVSSKWRCGKTDNFGVWKSSENFS